MRYVVMFIACVSVCVAHPTQQAWDFPLSGFAMKIRCFLTSLDPEDPLPNCTYSSLHIAIQGRREHYERIKPVSRDDLVRPVSAFAYGNDILRLGVSSVQVLESRCCL